MNPVSVILGIISLIFSSFVFSRLWNWFPAEIFNIIQINFWQSLGLFILINYIVNQGKTRNKEEDQKIDNENIIYNIVWSVVHSAVVLLIGYVVYNMA